MPKYIVEVCVKGYVDVPVTARNKAEAERKVADASEIAKLLPELSDFSMQCEARADE